MAVVAGKNTVFSLDDSTGTPVDLTQYCTEVSFTPDIQVHDTSVFGVGSRSKIVGIKDAKFTAKFFNDPTLQTHLIGLYGLATSSTFTYGPQGSTGGSRKITGECWLTGFPIDANVNDVESITATFEVTGALTFTTY